LWSLTGRSTRIEFLGAITGFAGLLHHDIVSTAVNEALDVRRDVRDTHDEPAGTFTEKLVVPDEHLYVLVAVISAAFTAYASTSAVLPGPEALPDRFVDETQNAFLFDKTRQDESPLRFR
jgi:hypothetical protein